MVFEIIKKWNNEREEAKEMKICGCSSRLKKDSNTNRKIMRLIIQGTRHKNDDFRPLLEFIRTELDARGGISMLDIRSICRNYFAIHIVQT